MVLFSKIFTIRNTYFQEHLRVFIIIIIIIIIIILTAVGQVRIYSLCFYLFFQKTDALYFFLQADYF